MIEIPEMQCFPLIYYSIDKVADNSRGHIHMQANLQSEEIENQKVLVSFSVSSQNRKSKACPRGKSHSANSSACYHVNDA